MSNSIQSPDSNIHWTWSIDDAAIAWLTLDQRHSSANVLSRAVMEELDSILVAIEGASLQGLIIHSAKPQRFIAGADIKEFPLISSESEAADLARKGQRVFSRLEALPCPSVAVINGDALGGGLELSLAATWRLALAYDAISYGLPEIKLGLHPGFGGTVRATELLGVRRAMDLMLTGKSIHNTEALSIGLIDRICSPEQWRAEAINLVRQPHRRRRAPVLDQLLAWNPVRPVMANALRRRVAGKAPKEHYPAPYSLVDLWRRNGTRSRKAAIDAEAISFGSLATTSTSRNLVRVFFLQDRLKHLVPSATKPMERVHVVGAGIMGGDIAAWCAARGLQVTLQDRDLKFTEPAIGRARLLFQKMFSAEAERSAAEKRLRIDIPGAGIADADVVIEAIFENLQAKRDLFKSLEKMVRSDAILASNTSSIPLEEIATSLASPERLVGLHFFNPVAKLPLVEVVHMPATAPEAVTASLAFVRQLRKLGLPCRSSPGFLVNRILSPYLAEAMRLMEEGVPLSLIDHEATAFGMPVGPIELADSVGLDVVLHVAKIMAPVLQRPVAPELEKLVEAGNLGRKTGRGFYVYRAGRPVRPRRQVAVSNRDVGDRLVFSLLNEAAECLNDRITEDQDLIDAGVIFGTGFAPFRGGPLQYARQTGVTNIVTGLERLSVAYGKRFTPSRGWSQFLSM